MQLSWELLLSSVLFMPLDHVICHLMNKTLSRRIAISQVTQWQERYIFVTSSILGCC